jgi:hypothetical protein
MAQKYPKSNIAAMGPSKGANPTSLETMDSTTHNRKMYFPLPLHAYVIMSLRLVMVLSGERF